jgi:hypothetical protein
MIGKIYRKTGKFYRRIAKTSKRLLFKVTGKEHIPMWIITIPKSGSMYIMQTLTSSLRRESISVGKFPETITDINRVKECYNYNAICHAHTVANDNNLSMLTKHGISKFVVHVRDPRQCVLSWTYWLRNDDENERNINNPYLPENYFDMTLEQQLAFQIQNRIPIIIDLIDSWIKCHKKDNKIDVLFTDFVKLKNDPSLFFSEISDFYGLERGIINVPTQKELTSNADYHYRKGDTDEWRSVYSQKQKNLAWELMPNDICELFSWGE